MAVDFGGHPMVASTGFNTPTRSEADIYDNFRARHMKTVCLMAGRKAHSSPHKVPR